MPQRITVIGIFIATYNLPYTLANHVMNRVWNKKWISIIRNTIVFTPGYKFKDMLKKASIQKLVTGSEIVDNGNTPTPPNPDGGGDGGDEEAPDPTV